MVYCVELRRNLKLTTLHLNHLNAGAGAPNLRSVLAVPPEGEDVLARLHLGHLHLVHDGEEELGGTWSYVALSVPREAGGWRRELR